MTDYESANAKENETYIIHFPSLTNIQREKLQTKKRNKEAQT